MVVIVVTWSLSKSNNIVVLLEKLADYRYVYGILDPLVTCAKTTIKSLCLKEVSKGVKIGFKYLWSYITDGILLGLEDYDQAAD